MSREYPRVARALRAAAPHADRDAAMQAVVDALWDAFADHGYSWVGFYLADESRPETERLVLGPRRDKPACSPIGLHGVCGAAYTSAASQIVRDVADLGAGYVACDPRDRSEVVVPLADDDGAIWGVLDVDSFEVGAFDGSDEAGLRDVLAAAGFTVPRAPAAG